MSQGVQGRVLLDPREVRRIEAASRALSLVPARGPAAGVFDAIRPCLPLAAGLLLILRPGAPDSLVSHTVRLPPEVFESWLGTPPEQLARSLAPVVSSPAGGLFRDSETITGALREQLDVLRKLDAAGLGEGAGYKVLERAGPRHSVEHFVLAALMARGEAIPARSQALLAALNPAIRGAVLRLGLPLLAHQSILAQIVDEQSLGYVCVSRRGRVLEANRRAHQLVVRYREAAGLQGRRGALTELAARARERAGGGRAWHIVTRRPPSLLEVNVHRLAKEAHVLPEDVVLVVMKEDLTAPAPAAEAPALGRLTSRQREVAVLVARSGASYKRIAEHLSLSEATVRKHVENVHRVLRIHSRAELAALLK